MMWDVIDALTMIPGIVGSHYLAWSSNDFVYRISVLSWGWCCLCSMAYHLSNCEPRLLKYDLRAQWVSQVFLVLETPQYSWPIILGGMIPVGNNGRMFLNFLGGYYCLWHSTLAMIFLTFSYIAYFSQFINDMKFFHSIFHVLVHCAGYVASQASVKKYSIDVHPDWAWGVFWVGAWVLFPRVHQLLE
jgi:hypothetical protein